MSFPKSFLSFTALCVILAVIAGTLLYLRPVPSVKPTIVTPSVPTSLPPKLAWPANGQGAIGAVGYGVLQTNKTDKPVPMASIGKIVTALAVLDKKPLAPGKQGPQISISQADLDSFNSYLARDGSVIPLKLGQQITQYQALQGLLIASANNVADTLARWAFGSVEQYVNYANQYVKNLGLTKTKIADASGFSPQTVSTGDDLVKLGEIVLKNPVVSEIMQQKQADFPGVGLISNVNSYLGQEGIIGIKTGNSNEAGGCYLFASERSLYGHKVTLIGAILATPTRAAAMAASIQLIKSADAGFELGTPVKKGDVVAKYILPWNKEVAAVATKDISVLNWKGRKVTLKSNVIAAKAPTLVETSVGTLTASSGPNTSSTPVVIKEEISAPSWTWRVFR